MHKNQVVVYDDLGVKKDMMKMAFDKIGANEALLRVIDNGNNELWNVAIEAYEEHLDERLAMIKAIVAARKHKA